MEVEQAPGKGEREQSVLTDIPYQAKKAKIHARIGMATTEVDLVVKTIRASRDTEVARAALMKLPLEGLEAFVRRAGRPESEIEAAKGPTGVHDYLLSERKAKAILDMRLAKLTGLEREKLAAEYGELCNEIARIRQHPRERERAPGRDR